MKKYLFICLTFALVFSFTSCDSSQSAINDLEVLLQEIETNYQTYTEEDWENMSSISGIFKSFNDAPGGLKEELREITLSVGAEYNYNQQFFLRAGYFYENEFKGNRQYFGLGAGFALNVLKLDASYMLATAQTSPLDQTLRFTLTFDMDGLKELMGK